MQLNDKKILVVDNDSTRLTEIYTLLTSNDFLAETCSDTESAKIKLRKNKFSLVVLNLYLDNISDNSLIQHLRSSHSNTSFILISDQTSFNIVRESVNVGAQDLLHSSFQNSELIASVINAFQNAAVQSLNNSAFEKLRKSENMHKFLVNSSPDILYVLDKEGCFSFINDRTENLLGYKPNDLIGTHYSKLVHHDDIEKAKYVFNERRLGDRASKNIEMRLKCKDDEKPRIFDTRTLSIEISSMGIYNDEDACDSTYLGTYGVARDVTDRKLAEEAIHYQSYHDPLTHLPNRALLHDRLSLAISHAKREDEMIAVMFLDLDRFKNINDSLGHLIGDELLQQVSKRLKKCIREGDTLARSGGDEFVLMLPNVSVNKKDVKAIAEKVSEALKENFSIEGHVLYVSASIGISIFPRDGNNVDTLIKNADIAMYDVKNNGKNNFQFYYNEMTAPYFKNLSLETGIRNALENKEFTLAYQPQINLGTGEISGVEALLRWNHPEHGNIEPSEFIPFAEETGLILELGEWVINHSLKQLHSWKQAGLPPIRMSINMSTQQLADDNIVDLITNTLNRYQLNGSSLEIEITENSIMEDMESVIHKLHDFHSQGITIAIDDFGTGYSSLTYLHKLPIQTLKIDKTFIKDNHFLQGEHSIVNTIITMANGLDLNVIAEGVETRSQLTALQSLNCNEVQGFFFGKALKADVIEIMLAQAPFTLPNLQSTQKNNLRH